MDTKILILATVVIIIISSIGVVASGFFNPLSSADELMDVCTVEEMKNYITNYGGSDDYLVDELESACSSFGTDLDGCPVYLDYSNFDVTVQPDGKQLAWSECVSVCEWDEKGRPMNGHILFSVIWYVGPPRTFEGLPVTRIGAFSTRPVCGWSELSWLPWHNQMEDKYFR